MMSGTLQLYVHPIRTFYVRGVHGTIVDLWYLITNLELRTPCTEYVPIYDVLPCRSSTSCKTNHRETLLRIAMLLFMAI